MLPGMCCENVAMKKTTQIKKENESRGSLVMHTYHSCD